MSTENRFTQISKFGTHRKSPNSEFYHLQTFHMIRFLLYANLSKAISQSILTVTANGMQ